MIMRDEKKIEVAATIASISDTEKGHVKNGYVVSALADHENGYREGYIEGAKWAINEFLKDLWHDVFKEHIPHNKRVIVEYTFKGGIYYRSLKIPDDIQWARGFSNEKRLRRWLFIDDLLPKEEV